MEVLPIPTPGLDEMSYLVVQDGRGVVIDPQRDPDRFLSVVSITHPGNFADTLLPRLEPYPAY